MVARRPRAWCLVRTSDGPLTEDSGAGVPTAAHGRTQGREKSTQDALAIPRWSAVARAIDSTGGSRSPVASMPRPSVQQAMPRSTPPIRPIHHLSACEPSLPRDDQQRAQKVGLSRNCHESSRGYRLKMGSRRLGGAIQFAPFSDAVDFDETILLETGRGFANICSDIGASGHSNFHRTMKRLSQRPTRHDL